jgi:hypothetical protein
VYVECAVQYSHAMTEDGSAALQCRIAVTIFQLLLSMTDSSC